MGEQRVPMAVRPRTVLIGMLVIAVVAAGVFAATQLWPHRAGRVDLAAPTDETVSFAGVFPAEDDESLANPLGIAFDGESLYVAESDAGMVRIFDTQGGVIGSIVLPVADGQMSAYPSVIAVADGSLAIIDNAGNRVIVVGTEPTESATVIVTLGAEDVALVRPTAVTYFQGEFFVADAGDMTIKVYDEHGTHLQTLESGYLETESALSALSATGGVLRALSASSGTVSTLDIRTGDPVGGPFGGYSMPRTIEPVGGDVLAVVDGLARAVVLLGTDGVERAVIDEESVSDAAMSSPRGATWVEDDGRLYVTDAGSGRVFVYNVKHGEL